ADGWHVRWNDYPRLLRRREDVDVGRQPRRLVERAHADEAHRVAGAGVVAPDRDAARRTAGDSLSLAAVRRRVDNLHFAVQHLHAICFDHRVQRECRAGFALAPRAVAAMHEQRPARQPIAYVAARATTVVRPWHFVGHRFGPSSRGAPSSASELAGGFPAFARADEGPAAWPASSGCPT